MGDDLLEACQPLPGMLFLLLIEGRTPLIKTMLQDWDEVDVVYKPVLGFWDIEGPCGHLDPLSVRKESLRGMTQLSGVGPRVSGSDWSTDNRGNGSKGQRKSNGQESQWARVRIDHSSRWRDHLRPTAPFPLPFSTFSMPPHLPLVPWNH